MEIQKVIGTKREHRDKPLPENIGLPLLSIDYSLQLRGHFATKTIQDSKNLMYTAMTRFPSLTIKNNITESRLLKYVEVNRIEIKSEIFSFETEFKRASGWKH